LKRSFNRLIISYLQRTGRRNKNEEKGFLERASEKRGKKVADKYYYDTPAI